MSLPSRFGKAAFIAGTAGLAAAVLDEERLDLVKEATMDAGAGAVRFSRAMYYAARVSADYKLTLHNKKVGTEEYDRAKSGVHERSAKRLLHVCTMHGGVYTKFGQHIASLNHVLPKEYTETLKVLQDRNPSVGMAEVERALRAELGGGVTELFAEFDERAIAAASLAQVHRAVTKTGQEVAVKLQYPGLQERVARDMRTMRLLAGLLERLFPEYGYTWMFPEFEEMAALELDFVQEAVNSERLARMFAGRQDIHVPPVFWPYTTRRVLTMEFVRGAKITHVDELQRDGLDPVAVARTVAAAFGDMIFLHGFVHCDPHPGNLMVRPRVRAAAEANAKVGFDGSGFAATNCGGADSREGWFSWLRRLLLGSGRDIARVSEARSPPAGGEAAAAAAGAVAVGGVAAMPGRRVPHEVVLLDHGMYRRLDPGFRHAYCRLWKAFVTRDAELGRRTAVELGLAPDMYEALSLVLTWRPPTTMARIGARISEEERRALRDKYRAILSAEAVNAFLESLPRDMLFVMRTGDLVRSLNKELGGSSRQRLLILGESAVKGLALPNNNGAAVSAAAAAAAKARETAAANSAMVAAANDAIVGADSAAISGGGGKDGDEIAAAQAAAQAAVARWVGPPDNAEARFRMALRTSGVAGPAPLTLSCPHAPVNLLVPSELGAREARLASSWELLAMRSRIWLFDVVFGLVWWWQGQQSFTTRDIG